jgi:hypothetical protein
MVQRIALGQVRFNLPGLATDARGVAVGRQLAARFGAIDRLVSFLRILSAEQSLDDLQPGLRIVYARGAAGMREAIVIMPAVTHELGDVVAHTVRLAGGQAFTGTGKHFVQLRDARAPLGYDVGDLCADPRDLTLYAAEQTVSYHIESELPLAQLLLRLELVRLPASSALPQGPLYFTARRGLGTVVAGYLHRLAGRAGGDLRAEAAACETADGGGFGSYAAFWLFRIERAPARLRGVFTRTPGIELFVPIADHLAVAHGYRHPIHLEACRGSFAADRLHLFSPRGVTEIAPTPTFAAIEDVVRIRVPAAEVIDARRAHALPPNDVAVALRLEPAAGAPRRPVATLVPWTQVTWLQRLLYALPPTALGAFRVALLERGVLLRANAVLEGIPFGTLYGLGAPDVLVPLGTELRPAVAPGVVSQRLGASAGAWVLFPTRSSPPLRILPEAIAPLAERLLATLQPSLASMNPKDGPASQSVGPIEIEHEPLGPMPLWGVPR